MLMGIGIQEPSNTIDRAHNAQDAQDADGAQDVCMLQEPPSEDIRKLSDGPVLIPSYIIREQGLLLHPVVHHGPQR